MAQVFIYVWLEKKYKTVCYILHWYIDRGENKFE